MAFGIGFGSGGFTGGPDDPNAGGPGRHGAMDPTNPNSVASRRAFWNNVAARQAAAYAGMRSAALPELINRQPSAFGGAPQYSLSPATAMFLIKNARRGLLTPEMMSQYINRPEAVGALNTLQSDFAGVRDAQAALAQARGTGHGAMADALAAYHQARQAAMFNERHGLTSAEYAQRFNR